MVVVVMTEEIMECQNLFWQYPAITEKTFYEQNKTNENFIGFPWATIIDKRIHPKTIIDMLRIFINPNINYYTCCQHIHFRQLVPLFKLLNINCVFSPHKLKGEEQINDVFIKPCPLYAVNLEDPLRNREFKNANLLEIKRPLLYSFHGAYNPKVYLTDIRKRLFEMEHPDNTSVKNIGGWFYESVVYSDKQNKNGELNETKEQKESTQSYNKLLLESRYSLCPSGSGPNSLRFWESLGSGAIPILLSDSLELPEHELWDQAIVRVLEKDVEKIPEILGGISAEQEKIMRVNCLKIYQYFSGNFKNKKKYNMVVFSNCHGEKYINIFKRDSNITSLFNIEYIVSYQQLNNFNQFKPVFCNTDILIINNIKKYEDYNIKNLKKILKPTAQLIVIPFIRFEGYWIPETCKKLQYIGGNSVSNFPDINYEEIEDYITRQENDDVINNHFKNSLHKLKQIESESDIKFYEFFIKNHTKIPFFRDNYHPTMNMLEFVAQEILKKIKHNFSNEFHYIINETNLLEEPKEYGHYKPIQEYVAKLLGLEYNLDTVFICDRRDYLRIILEIEDSKKMVKDLEDMKENYFNII